MQKFFLFFILTGLIVLIKQLGSTGSEFSGIAEATMIFGFILTISYLFGIFFSQIQLPTITGYIAAGILFGPYVFSGALKPLAIFTPETVGSLQLLDNIALGLIAFTAGGEIHFGLLRKRFKSLISVISWQVLLVLPGVSLIFILVFHYYPLGNISTLPGIIGVSLLLGITAVATSPATTIAIIQEYKSKGTLTEISLGITALKDVVVIIGFALILSFSEILILTGHSLNLAFLGKLLWEIFGSLGLGLLLGYLMVLYFRKIKGEAPLLVIALAFVSVAVSYEAHLSGLMICMTAGFYVENFSKFGKDLIKAVERHSLPIYVIFFTIAGAGIDLPALREIWELATILVISRMVLTYLGTWVGCKMAGEHRMIQNNAGGAFISQAGVTLGLATLIGLTFPSIGSQIKTLIIAGIAINQIMGPILFKVSLARCGEIPVTPPTKKKTINLEPQIDT